MVTGAEGSDYDERDSGVTARERLGNREGSEDREEDGR